MFHVVFCILSVELPRLGKRELICLLYVTCNYVVSVRIGFLFLWVLGVGCVILLWHSLGLPYNYFGSVNTAINGKLYGVPLNYLSCVKRITHYVNVSVLIMFSQKTSVFTLTIISSP